VKMFEGPRENVSRAPLWLSTGLIRVQSHVFDSWRSGAFSDLFVTETFTVLQKNLTTLFCSLLRGKTRPTVLLIR